MTTILREFEGTWEEIAARASELRGHRLKVIVFPAVSVVGEGSPTEAPIEAIIESLAAQVPDEEWDKLPADLSHNLDHYIYGSAKP